MEFHDYLAFLEQLCQELDALSGVEQQKISAVRPVTWVPWMHA